MPYVLKTVKPRVFSSKRINAFLTNKQISVRKGATHSFSLTKFYKDNEVPNAIVNEYCKKRQILERQINTLSCAPDIPKEYNHFTIPKKTGGRRSIDKPSYSLRMRQERIKRRIIDDVLPLAHTAAYAYRRGRSTKHCRMRHQLNKSKWFLHLDVKNFFGSLDKEFVMRMICMVYPYSELSERRKEKLASIMDYCFLNNGLPQGTVISPALSNLCMIPFDCEISKLLAEKGYVYTRYADDIEISRKKDFDPHEPIGIVYEVLDMLDAPLMLKQEKTHYGSIAGRNWGLGLMLNKDNKITIGHEKHKKLKAELFNLLMDAKNNKDNEDSLEDRARKLQGKLSYFEYIEPSYEKYVVEKLETKVGITLKEVISAAFCERQRKAESNNN